MTRMATGLAIGALAVAGACLRADDYEARRQALVDRPRAVIWDDDGCDMSHYPIGRKDLVGKPVSVRNFESVMLEATERTKVDAIFYSGTMGFGYFTASRAGDWFTNEVADVRTEPWRNKAAAFKAAFDTDALQMAVGFARRTGKEIFLSLRFNDNHDSEGDWNNPSVHLSPFKRANPDCLVGMNSGKPVKCCGWSAADFAQEKVRDFCRQYVRAFLENYDLDGIAYDFFRHPQLFARVARGGRASQAELDVMTGLMLRLKAIGEEVGRKRGRPFVFCARVPDSVAYCRAIGIDLERWLRLKAVDFLIVGGYFQLRPWRLSADLAHRHGLKCYASLDESRIRARQIPGRGSRACLVARMAAADAAGMDGVFHFNLEYADHGFQRDVLNVRPSETAFLDKLYFATYTGGGYLPRHFLVGGDGFAEVPGVDPTAPVRLGKGQVHRFGLPMGDAFPPDGPNRARVDVMVLADSPDGRAPRVTVNGKRLSDAATEKEGLFTFAADPAAFARGDNEVSVRAESELLLRDFAVRVTWSRPAGLNFNAKPRIN